MCRKVVLEAEVPGKRTVAVLLQSLLEEAAERLLIDPESPIPRN